MNNISKLSSILLAGILGLSSCERDKSNPIPVIPPSDGSKLTLQGGEGGTDAANAVYIDLSTNTQTAIARNSWSLGFYSGGEFRVIINNQMGYSAIETSQTDIKATNSSNTDISKLAFDINASVMKNYDDTLGRIDRTVIAEIKANASENKVFLVNTVHGNSVDKANVWKVKINRGTANDYLLQYGKIDDANPQSLTIKKDAKQNFNFMAFTNGPVKVEPAKDEWDIVWNKSMYFTNMGTIAVPYFFSDLVFLNHLNKVSVSQIIFLDKEGKPNGNPNYEQFDSSKLSEVKFNSSRNAMASSWRNTLSVGVLKDRFYVIKDSQGNIYKLKFLVMGVKEDGGKRGYPEIEYKLVKSN
ncbi:HmuY family protein [Sphingobacterium cellulitidis]|uniref:HmuY protein n=1 Tax=Sphingobacterium cellulitidis TaxID=1768011 RepID=A0A8H9KX80_9SPHI|nr:HmuY family protein [Sphingobacterium soli]MBA8988327.1 hypothetical protein [Sphingobacterium soli]GGE32087.1 hypothetical protein GCM10011516_32290 [Sphingobacterium soli]